MKRLASQSMRGFTMMELVVVIAIIGVLLALSMPAFAAYVDNARRDHDIACAKGAVAAAKAEFSYEYDGKDATTHVYTFDAASGEASSAKSAAGYGQWDQEADYSIDGIRVKGVAKDSFVTIGVNSGAVTLLQWGPYCTWETVVPDIGTSPTNNYQENAAMYEDLQEAQETDNDKLLQVDQNTIKAFANYFTGKTASELQSELGVKYDKAIGKNGEMLLSYRIDNTSCSIRLGYPAPGPGYLASIGYPTTDTSGNPVRNYINVYMSQYLFVSQEMTQQGTERQVRIKLTVNNGVCTACRIWVNGVPALDSDTIED